MIETQESTVFKNFETYDKFADIIINNDIKKPNLKNYFIFRFESIILVKEYLKATDIKFYEAFLEFLKKKHLRFKRNFYDQFNRNSNLVFINHRQSVDDSLAIIHEFTHYISHKLCQNNFKPPFVEVNSITYELLLSDYLSSKYKFLGAKKQIQDNMFENHEMAINAKLELELYKYLNGIGINKIDYLPKRLYDYEYKKKLGYMDSSIDKYGIYLLGNVFAAYIHQNILNKNLRLSDYKSIRDNIINQDYITLKKILNLDFVVNEDGFDITSDSLKKLEKAYISEVRYYGSK